MQWTGRHILLTEILLVTLAAIIGLSCGETEVNDNTRQLMRFLPDEIDDWVRQDSVSTFDRETIFKYIDGAGEVYNSYAFTGVLVARYKSRAGDEATVELFDMGNTRDAYGVFSYAREHESSGIGGGYELRGSVLCFWQDRFYVCVAVEKLEGSPEVVLHLLAEALAKQLPASTDRPELVRMLPTVHLVPYSDRYFHLHSVLNYNYYLARDNILNLGPQTDAVLARYYSGSTYVLIVKFDSDGAAARALESFKSAYLPEAGVAEVVETETGKFTASRSLGRYVAVVLNAPAEDDVVTLLDSAVSRLVETAE